MIIIFFFSLPVLSYATMNDALHVAVGSYEYSSFYPLILVKQNEDWRRLSPNDISGVPPTLDPYLTSAVHCSGNNCVIGGTSLDDSVPYLIISNDHGSSWAYPRSITGISATAFHIGLYAMHCIGNDCMAAGSYHEVWTCDIPLFLASNNGGQSWSTARLKNLPIIKNDCVKPKFIECQNDFCIAAGDYIRNFPQTKMVSLFVTNDKGKTWTFIDSKKINKLPVDFRNGYLESVNCQGKFCTVVGHHSKKDPFGEYFPLILTSKDSGNNWEYVTNPKDIPVNKEVSYRLIDCVGNACVVAGKSTNDHISRPFIITSPDRINWTMVKFDTIGNLPRRFDYDFLDLTALHCNEHACIIGGNHRMDPDLNTSDLFFLVSKDHGQSWQYTNDVISMPIATDSDVHGGVYNIKCTNAECFAAGNYDIGNPDSGGSYHSTLLTSSDYGLSWQLITNIKDLPLMRSSVLYNQFVS